MLEPGIGKSGTVVTPKGVSCHPVATRRPERPVQTARLLETPDAENHTLPVSSYQKRLRPSRFVGIRALRAEGPWLEATHSAHTISLRDIDSGGHGRGVQAAVWRQDDRIPPLA